MNRERRSVAMALARIEVREKDGGPGVLTGYASVFYRPSDPGTRYMLWDDVEERVMPGAFDRALREKDNAAALFNHDPNLILGRVAAGTLRLAVDERGLRYEVDSPDTQAGRDAVTSVRRGDVTGSSFGFSVTDEEVRKEKHDGKDLWIREIRGVQLYDVSPVTFPAYDATEVGARDALRARLAASEEAERIRAAGAARAAYDAHARHLGLLARG